VPFGTLVALLALWFGISVPLTFVGAYFGFKKPVRFFSVDMAYFIAFANHIVLCICDCYSGLVGGLVYSY